MTLYNGNCIDILRSLPENSIQCVVTSPPYYGLRNYNIEPIIWGEKYCKHEFNNEEFRISSGGLNSTTIGSGKGQSTNKGSLFKVSTGSFCLNCNAWRGCLGNEPNPKLYVEHLTSIFSEVWRILKKDGIVWLNLGDSYSGGGTHRGKKNAGLNKSAERMGPDHTNSVSWLKPKDLIGIPWRVAFALQEFGWWLRSDIIWYKSNCMPSSVKDRCTSAHEYIFMLTKSQKYYYDNKAIMEPLKYPNVITKNAANKYKGYGNATYSGFIYDSSTHNGKNKRDVWTIPTKPYKGAHFAVFPPEIPRLCILAGSKEGDTILDPFAGSGTTLVVAKELGRIGIGIEANPDYCKLIMERIS